MPIGVSGVAGAGKDLFFSIEINDFEKYISPLIILNLNINISLYITKKNIVVIKFSLD